jgi:glycosyltransferase involved in cell wall biosynthesis
MPANNQNRRDVAGGDQPLVSVIIPAYNCAAYVREAVDSALSQDYPALEVIVVDDGSTDGTGAVLESYGKEIRLLSQENRGCAAARNAGIAHARGRYVAFLDVDDVWRPDKIGLQIAAMRRSGHAMSYSRFIVWLPDADHGYPSAERMFGEEGAAHVSDCALLTGDTYGALLLDCIVWTSTVMVEREVLIEAGGFDESLQLGEDYELWLRLSRRLTMLGIEEPTALYRQHPASITRSARTINYEYLVLKRALGTWGGGAPGGSAAIEKRLARSAFNHGYAHYRHGDARIGAASFLQCLRHGHRRIKSLLLLLACAGRAMLGR